MEKKMNRSFVILCVGLIFLLFFSLLYGRFGDLLSKKPALAAEDAAQAESAAEIGNTVNWEERFPYKTVPTVSEETETAPPLPDGSAKDSIKTVLSLIKKNQSELANVGTTLAKTMYKERELSGIGLAVRSRLSDCTQLEDHVRLPNGYWIVLVKSLKSSQSAEDDYRDYALLQQRLNEKGIDFLYCFAPRKTCAIEENIPTLPVNHSNDNIDIEVETLNRFGVENLDLRKKLHEDGRNHYSLFFKTDHHWTMEAGLWAAGAIGSEITERFGIGMKAPSAFGTFTEVTFEGAMFGSDGSTATHFVEDAEDFTCLIPEFETNFRIEVPDEGVDRTGSFEELFVDSSVLEKCMKAGGGYAYGSLIYGNRPYEKITNYANPDGPRIFMIKDSFGNAVAPYLALSCSELVLLDTRPGNGNFTGSIETCIEEFCPDAVITVQNYPQTIRLSP